MATKKITYDNKVGIIPKTVKINQVWDDDMNEIKDVVNTNSDQTFQNTTDIANIKSVGVIAQNVSAVPSLVYLIGNNVQLQLNQTESNLIELYKTDKNNYKNLYQTGINRPDVDSSVLSLPDVDTLSITNVDNILFVNEVLVDSATNKLVDFVKSFGTVLFVVSGIDTPLAANTRGIFYVGVDKTGAQVFRTAKVYDQDICYLARLLVENVAGVYTIVSFKYMPDLSENKLNNKDRLVQVSGYIVPSGAASISFGNRAMTFYKNSINYATNKFDPNYMTLADSVNPAPMQFLFALPNIPSLAVNIGLSTTINPTQWYTAAGTVGAGAVGNANYQVYKVLLTVTGTIVIQTIASTGNVPATGNAIFGSREAALAGLTSVNFPQILPVGDSIGLGTFYLRAGTNVNGSQLVDSNDFYFRPYTSSSSTSSVGVTQHDLLTGKNDNPAFLHVTAAQVTDWTTAYDDRMKWDGGATGLVAATGRASLGASTVGNNIFVKTNPDAVTFLRANADNTVDFLDAASFRTAIGAGTGSVSGSGTTNYLVKWTGAATQSDSNIFDDGTNVGIGTTTPSHKLSVVGNAIFTNDVTITADDQAISRLKLTNTSSVGSRRFDLVAGVNAVSQDGFSIYDSVADATRFLLDNLGNIGIGTAPMYRLDVRSSDIYQARFSSLDGYGEGGILIGSKAVGDPHYYGELLWSQATQVFNVNAESGEIRFGTSPNGAASSDRMTILQSGNVGIGTTTPDEKLSLGLSGFSDGNILMSAFGNGIDAGASLTWDMNVGGGSSKSLLAKIKPSAFKTGIDHNTLDFYVGSWNNDNDVGSLKMTIVDNGNVGFGTEAPSSNVEIYGDSTVLKVTQNPLVAGGASIVLTAAGGASDINSATLQLHTASFWATTLGDGIKFGKSDKTEIWGILGSNVGIGTIVPTTKLDIRGTGSGNDGAVITLNRAGLWSSAYAGLRLTTNDLGSDSWNVGLIATTDDSFNIGKNGSSYFSIGSNNGNVGIGTTIPSTKLHVNGVIRFGDSASIGLLSYGTGLVTLETSSANTSIALLPTGTGNVGIGTTAPTEKLEVAGTIKINPAVGESAIKITTPAATNAPDTIAISLGGTTEPAGRMSGMAVSMVGNHNAAIIADFLNTATDSSAIYSSKAVGASGNYIIYHWDTNSGSSTFMIDDNANLYSNGTLSSVNPANTDQAAILEYGTLKLSATAIENQGIIKANLLTDTRSYELPNTSGTLALVEKVRPYKVYVALLNQTGTSAPTAIILENTLGGTIVWTRNNTGYYTGTLTGAFTIDKTVLFNNNPIGGVFTNVLASSIDTITVQTRDFSNAQKDDGLFVTSVEIRVYP